MDETQKGELKQTIFLIVLIVAICLMIFTVVTLIKNKNLIMSDPLTYGMKTHDFASCSCFDSSGNMWYSEGSTFASKKNIGGFE